MAGFSLFAPLLSKQIWPLDECLFSFAGRIVALR
jgi:hypothetical protein